VNCKLIIAWHQISEPGSREVPNELSLEESHQLTADFRFLEIFGSLSQFPGGANARFDPPAGANVSHIEFRLVRATLLIQKLVWPTVFRSTLNKMIMHKTPSFYYNPFINIFQKWDMFHLKNEGLRHNKIMESCCSSRNPYQHIAWDESPVWKFRIPSAREHCILPRGIRNVGS